MFDVINLDFLTIMQKNRNHGDFGVLPMPASSLAGTATKNYEL